MEDRVDLLALEMVHQGIPGYLIRENYVKEMVIALAVRRDMRQSQESLFL